MQITVKKAARIMGKSERTVQRLAEQGLIRAEKFSGVWMINLESAESYRPRPMGRPKTLRPWKVSKWHYATRVGKRGRVCHGRITLDATSRRDAIAKACARGLAGGDHYTATPAKSIEPVELTKS